MGNHGEPWGTRDSRSSRSQPWETVGERFRPRTNRGETVGKPWGNRGGTMGEPWGTSCIIKNKFPHGSPTVPPRFPHGLGCSPWFPMVSPRFRMSPTVPPWFPMVPHGSPRFPTVTVSIAPPAAKAHLLAGLRIFPRLMAGEPEQNGSRNLRRSFSPPAQLSLHSSQVSYHARVTRCHCMIKVTFIEETCGASRGRSPGINRQFHTRQDSRTSGSLFILAC